MRIGKFSLEARMAEREPEVFRAIMGKCIIVRCEMMYPGLRFEYVARCDEFDDIPDCEVAPTYAVNISEGGSRIEFVRAPWA